MPTWLKIVLGVIGGGLLLLGIAIAVGVSYFRDHRGEYEAAARAAVSEGRLFGHHAAGQRDCIDEGLRRLATQDGFRAEVANTVFATGCLEAAPATAGFCDGVPEETSILDSVRWRGAFCGGHQGVDPQACQRFLAVWQKRCHPR